MKTFVHFSIKCMTAEKVMQFKALIVVMVDDTDPIVFADRQYYIYGRTSPLHYFEYVVNV